MSITLSVSVSAIALKLAEFLKIIESTNVKIDKLIHNPFNTALKELDDAQNASSSSVAASLVESARANFAKASDLEKNEAQIVSLVGLAMCYRFMGDYSLVRHTVEKIEKAECDYGTGIGRIAVAHSKLPWYAKPGFGLGVNLIDDSLNITAEIIESNKKRYQECKTKILDYCKNNL